MSTDYAAIRQRLESMMTARNVTVESVQVSSRPDGLATDFDKSATHVRFTVKRNGHAIHSGYYSAGSAHSLPESAEEFSRRAKHVQAGPMTVLEAFKLSQRLRNGQKGMTVYEHDTLMPIIRAVQASWLPLPVDVIQSLLMDATGESFEEWCGNLGYDTDSRKALATWEACRESDRVCRGIFGAAFDEACDIAREF
jgi:hypothetical protein